MDFLRKFLKSRRWEIAFYALFLLIFFIIFWLEHVDLRAFFYPAVFCSVVGGVILLVQGIQEKKSYEKICVQKRMHADVLKEADLPHTGSWLEEEYRELVQHLCEETISLDDSMNLKYQDMIDYYTVWAHQIKTPIAAMQLHMQDEDTPLARQLREELFRIEQYVEMVLAYLRLDSDSTDYVFREVELDDLIRQAVRKFSLSFIRKKIKLSYEGLSKRVVTDEKWLVFVLEQVLSNALKYTSGGSVCIYLEQEDILCIRDTGIGIAESDLPRIFERGYTGFNGRTDKKASGLGLYLCKRVCSGLGAEISAESAIDQGTTIRIVLPLVKPPVLTGM